MKRKRNNSAWFRRYLFFFKGFLLSAVIGFLFVSCSMSYKEAVETTTETMEKTTLKLKRKIRFSDDDLQRMVAVVGFENNSLVQNEDFTRIFREGIPKFLNTECDDVTVSGSGADEGIQGFKELPRLESGQVDNVALALIGRGLGLNAVVTGSLDDIGLESEARGMLLKEVEHWIQVLVSVEVYDTETGTKILVQNYSRKLDIDEFDYDLMKTEGKLILPDLDEILSDLVAEMGEDVCWAIEDQPWNGFITTIAGDQITLSSGSNSGLEKGDQLVVFDTSRKLEGRSGQRFFVHGKKIGEVRIVEVEPDKASAVIITDEGIKSGSSVRVK